MSLLVRRHTKSTKTLEAAETLLTNNEWNVEQTLECFLSVVEEEEHGEGAGACAPTPSRGSLPGRYLRGSSKET